MRSGRVSVVAGQPSSYLSKNEGRRPKNRPLKEGGLTRNSWAGIPKRKRPNCHEKRYSRTSVGIAQKGGGPKTQVCGRGGDPRTLASRRHWLLQVVAATASVIWVDGRMRRPVRLLRRTPGQARQGHFHRFSLNPKAVAAACGTPSSRPSPHICFSWDSATPRTECHAQEKVTSAFLQKFRSGLLAFQSNSAVWKRSLTLQSCACRELTGRAVIATRHTPPHVCSHSRALRRLKHLSCLPQHAAEVDLEGSARLSWLIHRTQICTLIRPRSPPMGEKDFPRGSSMTVFWVSVCKNDVDFLIHFRMSSKISQGSAISEFRKKSSPGPAPIVASSQTGGSCPRSTSLFLHGIADKIGSSRAL